MPTTIPQSGTAGADVRRAWRPLQRPIRVANPGTLLATLCYQAFPLEPQYRGPIRRWAAMLPAEGPPR